MDYTDIINSCKESLHELDAMVAAIESNVLSGDNSAKLIADNVNFFTKSLLVTLCAQLEICIKDIVYSMAEAIDARLIDAAIPIALIELRNPKKKSPEKNEATSSRYKIGLTKKEVDDLVSGNVYKTKDSLLLVGVDLAASKAEWEMWKDLIQSIVTRRNNIVHHNDDASDITFRDIRGHIASIKDYLDYICTACNAADK